MTSARLLELVPVVMLPESRLFLRLTLPAGSPSCPFDGFTFLTASPPHSNDLLWCRTVLPAFHRLTTIASLRPRLTLGSSDVAQEPSGLRCQWFSHSLRYSFRHSLFSAPPPVLAVWLLRPERTLPYHPSLRKEHHSFGTMLEPRYVVGARALDQ